MLMSGSAFTSGCRGSYQRPHAASQPSRRGNIHRRHRERVRCVRGQGARLRDAKGFHVVRRTFWIPSAREKRLLGFSKPSVTHDSGPILARAYHVGTDGAMMTCPRDVLSLPRKRRPHPSREPRWAPEMRTGENSARKARLHE